MKSPRSHLQLFLSTLLLSVSANAQGQPADSSKIERGRYLVSISGCNDCHTPGFAESGGKAPIEKWLIGNTLGYHGPWGTTYASNLREYFERLSEDEWVQVAKSLKTRPPMPWFNVNLMHDEDLRAMHVFVRSLGPGGGTAPKPLPPGAEPPGRVVSWPMTKK